MPEQPTPPASTSASPRRTTERYIKYVAHHDVLIYLSKGWEITDPNGYHPLDDYSVHMEWPHLSEPPE